MNRYGTHGKRGRRGTTALLALTLAGGLLLTGCGGGDDASSGAKDTAAD